MALQHLRTSTAHKRPIPSVMSAGQLAININEASPGLFFKDSNGDLVKVGPVHIGTDAPNSSPASVAATALVTGTVYQILTVGTSDFTLVGASANTVGTVFTATGTTTGTGTVSGQQGVQKGEQWLDTTGGTYVLKIYDGTAWRSESGTFVDVNGDTMTGALLLDNAASAAAPDLSFDGDANTGIYSPGADQVAISTGGTGRLFVSNNGTITTSQSIGVTGGLAAWNAGLNLFSPGGGVGQIAASTNSSGTAGTLVFQTGTERMRITSDGKVGIGTPTPAFKLHVVGGGNDGAIRTDDVNVGLSLYLNPAFTPGVGAVQVSSNHPLAFITNGTERMRISSAGKVGIGTSSPVADATLTLSDASTPTLFFNRSGTNLQDGAIQFLNGEFAFKSGANSSTVAGLNEVVRIDAAGRLGIGTSDPTTLLEVSGGSSAGIAKIGSTANTQYGQLQLISNQQFIIGYGSSHATQANHVSIKNNLGPIGFFTAGAERMRINSSGNVGIGYLNAEQQLHVYGAGNQTGIRVHSGSTTVGHESRIEFSQNGQTAGDKIVGVVRGLSLSSNSGGLAFNTVSSGSGAERMRINSIGNVGIGTTAPTEALHVYGTNPEVLVQQDTNIPGAGGFKARAAGTDSSSNASYYEMNGGSMWGQTGGLGIRFGPSNRSAVNMLINTNTGNVGIGTTSPGAALHVVTSGAGRIRHADGIRAVEMGSTGTVSYIGSITAGQDLSLYAANEEKARIDSSGRLLVGTSSAGSVAGTIFAQGNSDASTGPAVIYISRGSSPTGAGVQLGILSYSFNQNESIASIQAQRDAGTWSVSSLPTRLLFSTTADGASTPTERMRLTNDGKLILSNPVTQAPPTTYSSVEQCNFHFYTGSSAASYVRFLDIAPVSYVDASPNGGSTIRFFTNPSTTSNASERMRIDKDGNVGIGTSGGATGFNNILRQKPSGGASGYFAEGANSDTWLGLYSGTGTGDSAALFYPSTGSFRIGSTTTTGTTGFSEKLRITSAGNVGIGTSSPGTKLVVKVPNGFTTVANTFSVLGANSTGFYVGTHHGGGSSGCDLVSRGYATTQGDFVFTSMNGSYLNPIERMRINTIGNVGIGTSSPTTALHVEKSGAGIVATFRTKSATDGAVIGLVNGGEAIGYLGDGSSIGTGDTVNTNFAIRATQTRNITFVTGNTPVEKVRILNNGNVGIGVTAQSSKLEVNGSIGIGRIAGGYTFREVSGGTERAGIKSNANNQLIFNIGNQSEAMRIDSLGKLLVGTSSSLLNLVEGGVQLQGTAGDACYTATRYSTSVNGSSAIILGRSKSATKGTNTIVADNDRLGDVFFTGADGSSFVQAAAIQAFVDGTPGANDMPGRLVFSTTADGASSPTEHFRIASNGDLTATDTTIGSNSDSRLKTNVADFTYDLENFKQYQPKTFDWKNPELHGNKAGQRGFIAQDVEAIDSYWVDEQAVDEGSADAEFLDADRLAKTLKLGKKDAMYVSVIQQLLSKIETLEAKVAALEAR